MPYKENKGKGGTRGGRGARGGRGGNNGTPLVTPKAKPGPKPRRSRQETPAAPPGDNQQDDNQSVHSEAPSLDEVLSEHEEEQPEEAGLTLADMSKLLEDKLDPINRQLLALVGRIEKLEGDKNPVNSDSAPAAPAYPIVNFQLNPQANSRAEQAQTAQARQLALGLANSLLPNVSNGRYVPPIDRQNNLPSPSVSTVPAAASTLINGLQNTPTTAGQQPAINLNWMNETPSHRPQNGSSGLDSSSFQRVQMAHKPKPPSFGKKSEDKVEPLQFVTELQQFQATLRYEDIEMLNHVIPYSLKDASLTWFTILRPMIKTMDDFIELFLKENLGHDFRQRMEFDLQNVCQGIDELSTTFLLGFTKRYKFLHPGCSDAEVIHKAMLKINPEIHKLIWHVHYTTIPQLCDGMQNAQAQLRRYGEYDITTGSKFDGPQLYSLQPKTSKKVEMLPSALDPLRTGTKPKQIATSEAEPKTVRATSYRSKLPFKVPFKSQSPTVSTSKPASATTAPYQGREAQKSKPSLAKIAAEILCYSCGNKGHFANKCPKKSLILMIDGKEMSWEDVEFCSPESEEEQDSAEESTEEDVEEVRQPENC